MAGPLNQVYLSTTLSPPLPVISLNINLGPTTPTVSQGTSASNFQQLLQCQQQTTTTARNYYDRLMLVGSFASTKLAILDFFVKILRGQQTEALLVLAGLAASQDIQLILREFTTLAPHIITATASAIIALFDASPAC